MDSCSQVEVKQTAEMPVTDAGGNICGSDALEAAATDAMKKSLKCTDDCLVTLGCTSARRRLTDYTMAFTVVSSDDVSASINSQSDTLVTSFVGALVESAAAAGVTVPDAVHSGVTVDVTQVGYATEVSFTVTVTGDAAKNALQSALADTGSSGAMASVMVRVE
jgi:hypothetical protein